MLGSLWTSIYHASMSCTFSGSIAYVLASQLGYTFMNVGIYLHFIWLLFCLLKLVFHVSGDCIDTVLLASEYIKILIKYGVSF